MSTAALRRKPEPNAYAELPSATIVQGPFAHKIRQRVDSPLEAAQRHLQQISFDSYQSKTKPERREAIIAELRKATEDQNEAIASVARYALENAERNLRYMGIHGTPKPQPV